MQSPATAARITLACISILVITAGSQFEAEFQQWPTIAIVLKTPKN